MLSLSFKVRSKPHAKHRGISKHSQTPQEKVKKKKSCIYLALQSDAQHLNGDCNFVFAPFHQDSDPEEPNEGKGSILPTFLPFEASSQEQEDEEVNNEGVQASEVVGFGEEEEEEEEEWHADKTQQQKHWSHLNTKFRSTAVSAWRTNTICWNGKSRLVCETFLIRLRTFCVSIKASPGRRARTASFHRFMTLMGTIKQHLHERDSWQNSWRGGSLIIILMLFYLRW